MTRGQVLALTAAVGYALQNLAMRLAAPSADPFLVALFAGLPTTVTSVLVTLASPGRRARAAGLWRDRGGKWLVGGLATAGVLIYAAGNPLFVRALALGGVVVATPSGNTVVIWSALLAAWLLGERVGPRAFTGVAVFVAGVLLLSWGQGAGVPAGPAWFWAIPLGATAGLLWSTGSIGTRYATSKGVDTYTILAAYGIPGLVVVAGVTAANGSLGGFVAGIGSDPGAWRQLALLVTAGLCNLGAQVALTVAYAYETVARASVLSSSSVAIVAVLAWAVLGETLNAAMFVGILGAFAGAALVQGEARPVPGDGNLPNGRKNLLSFRTLVRPHCRGRAPGGDQTS